MNPTCSTCRWFVPDAYPDMQGKCYAEPPSRTNGERCFTYPYEFCSRHQPHPKPSEPTVALACDYCRETRAYPAGAKTCRACHKPLTFRVTDAG
jgi:hypothetical protein